MKNNNFLKFFVVLMSLILIVPAFAQENITPSSVKFDGKEIFSLKTGFGSFSAEERALSITHKIEELAKNYNETKVDISVLEKEDSLFIVSGDTMIMNVSKKDALLEKKTQQAIAEENSKILKQVIEKYREQHKFKNIILGLFYSLIITVFFIVVLKLLKLLHSKIILKIENNKNKNDLYIQKLKILSIKELSFWIKSLFNILRIFISLVLTYFYFTIVFGMFPWTQSVSESLKKVTSSLILSSFNSFVAYLPNLLTIIAVVFVTYHLFRLTDYIFNAIKRGSLTFSWFHPEWSYTTKVLVKILMTVMAGIVIYPQLPGAGSGIFKSFSIFAGVLISVGSTRLVSNMVSGVILTYTRSFKEGERVKIVDHFGDVVSRDLLVTRLKTLKNEIISIPNSKVLDAEIINYSRIAHEEGLIVHSSITIGYNVPREQVEHLLVQAAKITENIINEKEPFVLNKELNDYYITYEINAFTNTPQMLAKIHSELNKNILDVFNSANVEIMSPNYTAYRNGENITIPQVNH